MLTAHAKVIDGGRLVLPAEIRRAMKLEKGDSVVLELDGDELRVRTMEAVVRRIQEKLRPYKTDKSIVEELIEERRREAKLEDEGR
ncbi:AbrB/MazE/SpoVT family DNA-binding domain-containing protein [Sphingomonas sp.]|uniref:AbrB/MazE/SpoVT family DNA-binding domain-containing protein n=1 Tax=Sphingomonas sp. TaxID=28214 RepID=UPI002DBF4EC9|nr:AbrB/MazE/SpoVT family DNA-binding domain-containing protein [Sphingomonas sp.]HEU4967774.1 AbrB/MazE/SpoVT family DNA-binding domain-containing protein [Sphingomonas sp.]